MTPQFESLTEPLFNKSIWTLTLSVRAKYSYLICILIFGNFYFCRLFRIKVHNNFAQEDDVFAEDAVVESTDGPIDASAIRKRIYSGILEGKKLIFLLIKDVVTLFLR